MGARGGATVVGLAVAGLGLFFLLGARTIEGEAGQAGVGPRAFPTLIGAGLVVLGAAFVNAVRRGRMELPGAAEQPAARGVLPWLLAGLAGGIVLIEPLGFPVAAAWLFVLGARGFGSPRWVRNAVLGVLLGVLVYLVFARALGVSLPGGPMDRVWPRG
jgi:putative tricarboxylic transport membrane protein